MSDEFPLSPEDLTSGRFLPPEIANDLRILANVDHATIAQVAKALDQEPGILTEQRVLAIVKEHFNEDATAEALTRTVLSMPSEDKGKILWLVDRWRHFNEERTTLIPDAQFEVLKQNVDALVRGYPALELMRKSRRLLRDTGNEIEDALFVCDLRPVYNDSHERVEGFVSVATLRIRYVRQTGDRGVFELCLTEDELEMLVEQGSDALRKFEVLRDSIQTVVD